MRSAWPRRALAASLVAASVASAMAGSPTVDGVAVFPPNNIWNVRVDHLPVASDSDVLVNTMGASASLHADFGSGIWPPDTGGPIGIPYVTVPGTQERVNVTFLYASESDPGPYPIPTNAPIEGGTNSTGDRHVLVIDRDNAVLYELFSAYPQPDGSWHAGSGAVFDLNSNALRPATWTSADAAGLPVLPGLVRYDEAAAGEIRHALRFTAPQTRRAFVWPARHFASSLTGLAYPPMGQRFRLKANVDISAYPPEVQAILRALKRYGMMLADNGSAWYIQGVPDERWDNGALHDLHQITGSDFEAVNISSLFASSNNAAILPRPTVLQAAEWDGQSVTLSVSNVTAGAANTVEASSDLASNEWHAVGVFTGVSAAATWSGPFSNSVRASFFRIRSR